MDNSEQKLRDEAANASLIALNANFLYPWIERRIQEIIQEMSHDFKHPEHASIDNLKIAYIVALKDLKAELDRMAKRAGSAVHKLHPHA